MTTPQTSSINIPPLCIHICYIYTYYIYIYYIIYIILYIYYIIYIIYYIYIILYIYIFPLKHIATQKEIKNRGKAPAATLLLGPVAQARIEGIWS